MGKEEQWKRRKGRKEENSKQRNIGEGRMVPKYMFGAELYKYRVRTTEQLNFEYPEGAVVWDK